MRSTLLSASLTLFSMACGESASSADCVIGEQLEDRDCDGVSYADDCDDLDPNSTVKQEDADCDTVLSTEDCDDTDGFMPIGDADCDNVPTMDDCNDSDPTSTTKEDDADCDTVLVTEDCDDTNASMPLDDADCDSVLTAEDCDDNDEMMGSLISDPECDDRSLYGDYTVLTPADAGYLRGHREVTGTLTIQTEHLSNLDDLVDLRRVGALRIISSPDLTSFSIQGLESITADLYIDSNATLTNFTMPSLSDIGGDLSITNNDNLCQSIVDEFVDALEALEWSGDLAIIGNDDSC
jgi:hypothetical protein